MGSKSAGPGGQMGNLGGMGQSQGDVQPFDMPPMQQVAPTLPAPMGGGYPDPAVPKPRLGGQGPAPGMPPMPQPPFTHNMGPDFTPGGYGKDVLSLYEQELGRNPDHEGMNFWLSQLRNGMSMEDVRRAFDQSEEGQAYNQRLRPMIDDFSRPGPGATLPAPMPPRAPIERPMMPPEVLEALRLAMQNQTQPPMGQTPMPVPQQRGMPPAQRLEPYNPAAQSDAPQIARAMRIVRGLPVY